MRLKPQEGFLPYFPWTSHLGIAVNKVKTVRETLLSGHAEGHICGVTEQLREVHWELGTSRSHPITRFVFLIFSDLNHKEKLVAGTHFLALRISNCFVFCTNNHCAWIACVGKGTFYCWLTDMIPGRVSLSLVYSWRNKGVKKLNELPKAPEGSC